MDKYVLLGGLGKKNDFGGEITKNRNIISALENRYHSQVRCIDVYSSRKSPLKLMIIAVKFLYYCIFTNRTIIFSTTYGNIIYFLKFISIFHVRNKLILWVIGSKLGLDVESGKYQIKYLKLFDKVIVEFSQTKEQLCRCGLTNVHLMSNFKVINYIPQINKYDDNRIHFVFISRIMPEKGVEYIIESCEKLNDCGYENKYLVDFYGIPENNYHQDFVSKIANLENVTYKGGLQLNIPANYDILAKYHFMLFPTYWQDEGCPGVVIDSAIAGVPMIASDWRMNSQLIHDNKTGILIPVHDVNALHQAMKDVIVGKYDIKSFAQNCQKEIDLYRSDVAIDKVFAK